MHRPIHRSTSLLLAGMLLLLLMATSEVVLAQQNPPGRLTADGSEVTVEILPDVTATYTSDLWLYDSSLNPVQKLASNRDAGQTFNIGQFPSGQELVFAIFVRNTGNTFFTGPASRNPDNIRHAWIEEVSPGVVIVHFEDLEGGGDNDFNDLNFRVTGVTYTPIFPPLPPTPPSGVPLFDAWTLTGFALLMLTSLYVILRNRGLRQDMQS